MLVFSPREVSMQTRMTGLYPWERTVRKADIFGYSSKSLPGIEIIGLGKIGKSIKEKLVYLSKSNGIKIPLKRYVLCVDRAASQGKETGIEESLRWLEFPLLVLFWSLSENLAIKRLDDCYASGRILVSGTVEIWNPNVDEFLRSKKLIAPSCVEVHGETCLLPFERMIRGTQSFNYCEALNPLVR